MTPASGEHVPAVVSGPVVEGAPPPVEGDVDHLVVDLAHCGAADKVRILLVHRLEFLTNGELVALGCAGLLLETLVRAINCILESSGKKFRPGSGIESEAHRGLEHASVLLAVTNLMELRVVHHLPEVIL